MLVQLETEIACIFLFFVCCRKHTWQFPTLVLRHQNFMITQKPVLAFSVTESRCVWGSGLFTIRHNLSNVFRIRILAKAGICALVSYYNFASLFISHCAVRYVMWSNKQYITSFKTWAGFAVPCWGTEVYVMMAIAALSSWVLQEHSLSGLLLST